MIADITSSDGCSESPAFKASCQHLEPRTVENRAVQIAPAPLDAGPVAEHHLLALAWRSFAALLPTIETLSTDLE